MNNSEVQSIKEVSLELNPVTTFILTVWSLDNDKVPRVNVLRSKEYQRKVLLLRCLRGRPKKNLAESETWPRTPHVGQAQKNPVISKILNDF